MMDTYQATELAYKNGYEKGYDEGFAAGVVSNTPKVGYWKYTSEGDRICSNCGMLEPDCLPGACAIHKPEKRYCFYCGTKLIYPEGLS